MRGPSWKDYERAAQHGPWPIGRKVGCALVLIVMIFGVVGVALNIFGFFTGAANNAVAVARKEFYPDALLRKYEWFKDAAAALDRKVADIQVYERRFASLKEQYAGASRATWPREDREQANLWESEVAGVTASYNALAADYNSQMSKFNWRFTNVGDLPPGASEPLPREFKPYMYGGAK